MTFESQIDRGDWSAYQQLVFRRHRSWWKTLILLAVLLGAPWAFHETLQINFFAGLGLTVLGEMGTLIYLRLIAVGIRPRNDGFLFATRTFTTEDQGLRIASEQFELIYNWAVFESAGITERVLVLFLEPAVGVPISRRCLHPEDFHDLIKILQKHCPQLAGDLHKVS